MGRRIGDDDQTVEVATGGRDRAERQGGVPDHRRTASGGGDPGQQIHQGGRAVRRGGHRRPGQSAPSEVTAEPRRHRDAVHLPYRLHRHDLRRRRRCCRRRDRRLPGDTGDPAPQFFDHVSDISGHRTHLLSAAHVTC
jgi:hypothetical protein